MRRRLTLTVTILAILISACSYAGIGSGDIKGEKIIWNDFTTISTVSQDGKVTGFKIYADGSGKTNKNVVFVELISGARWHAKRVSVDKSKDSVWIEMREIDTSGTGNTPEFGPQTYIKITLFKEKLFPRVDFVLDLKSFKSEKWESSWQGKVPLYFLRASVEDALIFYQSGLLYPSPTLDSFPISLEPTRGMWAENWSYAPAIGAHSIPAFGLWSPKSGMFVGYEFQHSHSTDKSSKYFAGAYCAGQPDHPGQFFTLVYPYQTMWTILRYPSTPEIVGTHFTILYELNMPSTADPNRFILNYIWKEYQSILPPAPAMNDLGWMAKRDDIAEDVGGTDIIYRSKKERGGFLEEFFRDNTLVFYGNFRGVDTAYRDNKKEAIEKLKKDIELMISCAIIEKIDGDECIYWKYPLEGGWEERMGGDRAATIHNVQQWGVGAAMLSMYKNEKDPKLLRYIDGLFRWTRHYLFTRGDICDLPSAMFTLQATTVSLEFLMNYHLLFRTDPERRKLANEALDRAYIILYRNLPINTDDPDESDWLDPTFLMQPNNHWWWIGQVTWAEMGALLRSMIVFYVETGDPILKYYIRGALDRWYWGFTEDSWHTVENIEIFGQGGPKGNRTGEHDSMDPFQEFSQPVGDATMHITCGRKASISFCKGTEALDISDYQYEEDEKGEFLPGANFSFRIIKEKSLPVPESFNIIVSAPFKNLSDKPILINGKVLSKEKYSFAGKYNEHLIIKGVNAGDSVQVGELKKTNIIPFASIKTHKPLKDKTINIMDFECVNLEKFCNEALNEKWDEPLSWAGLVPGKHFFKGAPFLIVDSYINNGKNVISSTRFPVKIPAEIKCGAIHIFARVLDEKSRISLIYEDGKGEPISFEYKLKALDGFPKRTWEINCYSHLVNPDKKIKEVLVEGGVFLFAISFEKEPLIAKSLIAEARQKKEEEKLSKEKMEKQEVFFKKYREEIDSLLKKKYVNIGFIPPAGINSKKIGVILAKLGIPFENLSVEQMIDSRVFSPDVYPVIIYTGEEKYINTFKEEGDGANALIDYLSKGGVLLFAGSCFPLYYKMRLIGNEWKVDTDVDHAHPSPFGEYIQLYVCGSNIKRGESAGFESPPDSGKGLKFRLNKMQNICENIPNDFSYLENCKGDLRYRPITSAGLPEEDKFIPAISLSSEDGTNYGPAVAAIEHHCNDFKEATTIYIWGSLIQSGYGEDLLTEVLTYAVRRSKAISPENAARIVKESTKISRPMIAVLPPDDGGYIKKFKGAAGKLGLEMKELTPEEFVNPSIFNPINFPVAIHASGKEAYIKTYNLRDDGEEAYFNYLRNGGFFIFCGRVFQFYIGMEFQGGKWKQTIPSGTKISTKWGLTISQGFESPGCPIFLELDPEQKILTGLPGKIPLDYVKDQRYRSIMDVRLPGEEFVPIAYLTDDKGKRFPDHAIVYMKYLEGEYKGSEAIAMWGNLLDGKGGVEIMEAILSFALKQRKNKLQK